ncbi:proline--tRNA ligase [Candidatus Igneacidithiobacillus taiwanensis]|uniref:proline--tRNA ligase n=1 Tax=Candidatus Igneacidithiobacillus taiwanensis TaxID=1945924 RepID=UPI002896B229|nr:proline--tRNA ligase [Candidatus Igneacidithiobacillus taiwanensis]MCE5360321.1 proline--tRNA ligase [Acidithiobacillus sp.]
MRASQLFLPTLKETPAEAELVSHQLLLRGGFIRRLASGLYTWLPLGLLVLRRVEAVVREEMERAGAQEILMPVVQPAELWQESGRWEMYGPELLRLKDRHQRDFCLGPTHEEVISDLARRELRSYRQLPINLYQIQTKFRDEIRPRFGLMRAREFLMKDAYSFHIDQASLQETYQAMYDAYSRVFARLGLEFRAVDADTGAIGGKASHEFHVLADSGEDAIVHCSACDYAANQELARSAPDPQSSAAPLPAERASTPGIRSVEAQAKQLGITPGQVVKTLLVMADDTPHLLLLRGDDELNLIKATHALDAQSLRLATAEETQDLLGIPFGFIGPKDLPVPVPILADHRALALHNFSTGANVVDEHWLNLNWERDLPRPPAADLRNVQAGDACPHCATGVLGIRRGIEVGHVFQLGTRYSEKLGVKVLNEAGKDQIVLMGCYGIGVSRIVAAAVEQNFDERGICWPAALAPFDVGIVAIQAKKSPAVLAAAAAMTAQLEAQGLRVLLDDRDERPGVQFATLDLIGLPHRLVISDKTLAQGVWEYRARRESDSRLLSEAEVVALLLGERA